MSMILLYMVAALTADPDALDSRIASYGGALAIDLDGDGKDRGVEAGRSRYVIEDCSTEADLCLEGYVVRLSVPRYCPHHTMDRRLPFNNEILVADTTAEFPSRTASHYVDDFVLIGSEDRPWVVYTYAFNAGLVGVFADYNERADIVALAKSDGMGGLLTLEDHAGNSFMDLRLETIRGLMPCDTSAPR